jgi:hypothetical protein
MQALGIAHRDSRAHLCYLRLWVMPVEVWEYAPLVGYDYGINDAVPESILVVAVWELQPTLLNFRSSQGLRRSPERR